MKHFTKIMSLILIVFFSQCAKPGNQNDSISDQKPAASEVPSISSEQSKKVLEHHLKSFGENNLKAVMEDYIEESIIITPDSSYTGLAQIEAFFAGLIPAFPTEGTTFELDKMEVKNDLAYIVWHAKTPAIEVPLGTDTYIIQNEKIMKQTFAGVINPVEK